ncbi:MAG: DUF4091 domain-containing protein [Eubacteriales bacterium]
MVKLINITSWFTNSFSKILPDTENNGNTSYKLYMAKNEMESCQLILHSVEKLSNLVIETDQLNKIDTEILREYYIETQADTYYPDPIAPTTDNFILNANENLTFLIKFKTTERTNAGEYNVNIKIKQNDKNILNLKITIHIWDFILPESSSCATAVGLYPEYINKLHGIMTVDKQIVMYKTYYDYLLENRVCAYSLPYDILDNRADEYLDNPRVTNLVIPYSKNDDIIRAYYKKLSANPIWFSKAIFYPLDEPTSNKHLDELKVICERLDKLYPGYQLVTPFFTNIQYNSTKDQIDYMTGLTNIWCPKTFLYITSNIYSTEQLKKYSPFGKRMDERKAAGDRIWWYVCWEPGDPYCNLFVDMDGIMHRLLFWQQKLYNVDGFLYWGANYWRGTDDPWTDMRTVKDLSMDVFGDGSLLYNGNKAGKDGPAGSMRLEAIRDGIEDFDMFTLAEKYLGREYVVNIINEVTSSVIKYSKSEDKFSAVRIKIGDALEKVVNSQQDSINQ